MSNFLLSVFLIGMHIISDNLMAAEKVTMMTDCNATQSSPVIDKDFVTRNDWHKWQYRLSTQTDINKDGKSETIWLIADIAKDPNSSEDNVKWLYDEGAPWAIVIESPDEEKTLVYLQWSQFGRVHAFVVDKGDETNILIVNRQTAAISIYEVKYQGPGLFSVCQILERDIQAFAQ